MNLSLLYFKDSILVDNKKFKNLTIYVRQKTFMNGYGVGIVSSKVWKPPGCYCEIVYMIIW